MTNFRGAQVAFNRPTSAVDSLLSHKANIIRYPIFLWWQDVANLNAQQYRDYVQEECTKIDLILANVPQHKAVLDVHVTPAGLDDAGKMKMFYLPWARQCFIDTWRDIAERYKNSNSIYVFGVCNEPRGSSAQVQGVMKDCRKVIREVSKDQRIALTGVGSDPLKFNTCPYFDDNRLWYEVHMYSPMPITHQGLPPYPAGKNYPNSHVTKARLIKDLAKVRTFQAAHPGSRIYCGEFSISTYASEQSRINYLTDCISLFEQYNWNWTYHAWREATVWDVEPYPAVFQVLKNKWNLNG